MNYIEVAQELIGDGFNPLPLKENKAPKLPVGHPFLYKAIDRIEQRFKDCEKIGIACGTVSDGFYCIDFDKHQGQDIELIFSDFFENASIQRLLDINQIIFYKTPSGGFHAYVKLDKEISGTVYANWKTGDTMIELRGNGQYVATYPSQDYQYVAGCDLVKLDRMDYEVFEWIISLAKSYDQDPNTEVTTDTGKSERKWAEKWDEKKVDGNFNIHQGDYAKELLKEVGWKYISTRRHDGIELWQRPGKAIDEGISATFGKRKNMFYVFSSNASPFKQETAYSPFNIYTLLKYDGDWKKAKDSLKVEKDTSPEASIIPASINFPLEVFPEFIRNYINELNRTLNFHVDFSAAAAMFTVATVNGNKYKLRVKNGWEAQTIFWFACVGYPGTIKTHPVKTLTRPLSAIDITSKAAYDLQMTHYNPDAKGKAKTPKPKFKQMLISDYTIEALHSVHDIHKRGIGLYKDELKGFLNDMNKYRKGSDEEFWLESFNNGSYIVNRVTREPVMVKNICINMIGTIQHDVLSKVIVDYQGNGLIDRFLFTASESTVYPLTNEEIAENYSSTWSELIHNINTHFSYIDSQDTEILSLDSETFAIYQEIDAGYVKMQNSEDYPQEVKNYLSKMKTYVPRFALLLAIMEGVCEESYIEVKPKHMIDAGKVAQYFIKTAESTFSFNEAQSEIASVESHFRGLKKNEKIQKLFEKGFKQIDIAKFYGVSRQAVSKVLATPK